MSESFKYFTVNVSLPNKQTTSVLVWARTKWEAIELLMYRQSFSRIQPDRTKYSIQGKKLQSTQKKIEQK